MRRAVIVLAFAAGCSSTIVRPADGAVPDDAAVDASTDGAAAPDATQDALSECTDASFTEPDADCAATCASALAQVQLHLESLDCGRFLACPIAETTLVACDDPCPIIDQAGEDAARNVCSLDLVRCPCR